MKLSSQRKKQLEELQKGLNVKFMHLNLLNQALTHASYAKSFNKKNIPYNEKLEFLGDAVLELVIVEYLFKKYPRFDEGKLSKSRSMIVSEEALSHYARKANIGPYILISEDQKGIQSQDALLADTYEAIIGALYLDRGLRTVRDFILNMLTKEEKKIKKMRDFKSCLQEYTQSLYKCLPQYELVQEIGPDHYKTFKVRVMVGGEILGEGAGSTKRKAEKMAARSAWEKIRRVNSE
jgi:ribonuclease-3